MAKFLFSYRMPVDCQPGRPDAVANWLAFLDGMGDHVVEGQPVSQTAEPGDCGAGTRPGGYWLISADDLETARAGQGLPGPGSGRRGAGRPAREPEARRLTGSCRLPDSRPPDWPDWHWPQPGPRLRWMSQTLGSQYRPLSWSRSMCTGARPAGNT
jgi:hypothetical protein